MKIGGIKETLPHSFQSVQHHASVQSLQPVHQSCEQTSPFSTSDQPAWFSNFCPRVSTSIISQLGLQAILNQNVSQLNHGYWWKLTALPCSVETDLCPSTSGRSPPSPQTGPTDPDKKAFLFCQDIHQQWYLDVWHNGQIGAVDYQELFQFGECLVVDRGHIEQVRYIPAVSPNLWLSFQISSSSPVTLFVHLPRCKSFNELGVCSHHISHVNKTVGIRYWSVSRLGLKIASVFNLNLWNRENLKCKWGRAFSRHQRLDLGWITFGQIWIWYILPRKKCFENIVW